MREDWRPHTVLGSHVSEMGLCVRGRKCLERLGIRTVADLIARTEGDLRRCRNFGVISLEEIREKLDEVGLRLRDG